MTAGYYRYPTIHDNTIVFVSEDDLWVVPTGGGMARRLTSNLGAVTFPLLSPNGEWLAFVGREEGRTEVYVMAAEGGTAQRLTYLSSSCRVVGWSPDGQDIIFCSNHGQIIVNEYGLFRIARDCTTATVRPIDCGPARIISYGPDRQAILGRNTQDSSRWKRYRGGTTGHFWIDRTGNGDFERFLDQLKGNTAFPMWIVMPDRVHPADQLTTEAARTRIFFVSDHEGIGNLYSCDVAGADLRRHTDHEDYYVRSASTDGKQIVYQVGADIYCYNIADDREQLVEITYHSPRVQRSRRFVDATRFLDSARLHPKGKAMAITTRGKAFAFYNHEGPVLQYGEREGVRYRLPEWSDDGRHLILISDVSGEEVIEIHPDDPQAEPRRLEGLDLGRTVMLKLSPTGNLLALTNHRNELLLVDLASGDLTVVDRSPYRLIAGFDWSPDGHWLTYGCAITSKTTAIRLYRLPDPEAAESDAREGAIYTITQPILRDVNPVFDPDGKYLYFLSYREFNPVYDNLHFELGFPWGMRPYLITLQSDLPNPFIPLPGLDDDDDEEIEADEESGAGDESSGDVDDALADGSGLGDEEGEDDSYDALEETYGDEDIAVARTVDGSSAEGDPSVVEGASTEETQDERTLETADKATKEKEADHPRLQIDLAGIEERILPFPVPDGRYGQIAGIPGKVLFTALPVEGALDNRMAGDDEYDDAGMLRCYTFADYKTETIVDDVNWFQLSRDRKRLLYSAHRRLRVLPAGEKPQIEHGPSRRSGWIDLSRIKVSVDPQREWEQMFREAWRLQRDHFWTEDMSEVDWHIVYQRYYPLIERVSTRGEFSDLMWEMQGELGTSHAYEYGGDYRAHPYYSQGFLGTTFRWDAEANGYRVGPIVVGDSWDLNSTSPLVAPGVDVEPGDLLLAINGQRLDEKTPPAQLLVNQAGQDILLTFAPRLSDSSTPLGEHLGIYGQKTVLADAEDGQKVDGDSAQPFAPAERTDSTALDKASTRIRGTGLAMIPKAQGEHEPTKGVPRGIIVRTIYGEEKAYYRAWVNRNQRRVHDATAGRVGYVHIPDMGATGYAEFHRSYLAEVDREALIVDVRYNGGGHVSQLILEKLARRRLGYDFSRWGGLEPYPADSVAGPIVALTNEHAGSDGDIFCHSFKLMKLGTLIGKRTWGGVVGISPHHALVDGTVTTQPEFSFWFADVGWSIENYGAEPDIEVDIRPQDYRAGTDPQLERAIVEVMNQLVDRPISVPDIATRPSRALPKLPPRVDLRHL